MNDIKFLQRLSLDSRLKLALTVLALNIYLIFFVISLMNASIEKNQTSFYNAKVKFTESAQGLMYKSLELQYRFNSLNKEQMGQNNIQFEEINMILSDLEQINQKGFLKLSNNLGVISAYMKDNIETIRILTKHYLNKKPLPDITGGANRPIEIAYGIDNLISKLSEPELIEIHQKILDLESGFLKARSAEVFNELNQSYQNFYEHISNKVPENFILKGEILTRLNERRDILSALNIKQAPINVQFTSIAGNIEKLHKLTLKLNNALADYVSEETRNLQREIFIKSNLGYLLYMLTVGLFIIIYMITSKIIIKPIEYIGNNILKIADDNFVYNQIPVSSKEIDKIVEGLKNINHQKNYAITKNHELETKLGKSFIKLTPNLNTRISDEEVTPLLQKIIEDYINLYTTYEKLKNFAQDTFIYLDEIITNFSNSIANVNNFNSSIGELSSSIKEIAKQTSNSTLATKDMVDKAEKADLSINNLTTATTEINVIIQLITDIAEQINLLALNATIESARAGAAGRGFAIVAGEVKNLARQTSSATEQIAKQIENIQSVSSEVVESIKDIKLSITNVNIYSNGIASAVEEQSSVTSGIVESISGNSKLNENLRNKFNFVISESQSLKEVLGTTLPNIESFKSELEKLKILYIKTKQEEMTL